MYSATHDKRSTLRIKDLGLELLRITLQIRTVCKHTLQIRQWCAMTRPLGGTVISITMQWLVSLPGFGLG